MVATLSSRLSSLQPIHKKSLLAILSEQTVYHNDIEDAIETPEAFLKEFHAIVSLNYNLGIVNTENAGKILKIIARYRHLTGKYDHDNIRSMIHTQRLVPLSKEEEREVFGFAFKNQRFFLIVDLFQLNLSRWAPENDPYWSLPNDDHNDDH